MKRSVRPLFSMCLLIAIAATLAFRIVLRAGPSFADEVPTKPAAAAAPVFNATLLRYAAIDLGEPKMKQEIEDLVEGNFKGAASSRQRSFLSSGKYRIDIRARSARGMPVQLRSPEFYRLWLQFRRHLQDWSRKRRFQPDIMSNLVSNLKPFAGQNDSVLKLGKKYKTCAVVGNSGILLKRSLGAAIDSHEFVIRLNNARTTSYEVDVGQKTSVSFINSNILHFCARRDGCYCHPYGQHIPIVMYVCQPVHFLDYTLCNASHKAPLVITDPGFDMLCARIVKYYSVKRFLEETGKSVEQWVEFHDGNNFHYSSGMQAVMLALGICDEVSIFGFGKSNSTRHHYHTNQKAELGIHDYEAEYDLYRDMAARPQEEGKRVTAGFGSVTRKTAVNRVLRIVQTSLRTVKSPTNAFPLACSSNDWEWAQVKSAQNK